MNGPLYFGCWPERTGGAGHYLFDPQGHHVRMTTNFLPFGRDALDGRLIFPWAKPYEVCQVQAAGWSFFAFHDYTGDSRPGSNSVFIDYGEGGWFRCERRFRGFFPQLFARYYKAGVKLLVADESG